ncbi:MAG TPA: VWA domain-containing protein [Spirochaetota bacterium]|nr:VWA domain-containing protein [Spirochaetota bacterium]
MNNRIFITLIALLAAVSLSGKPGPDLNKGPKIQLAILLDTSSSMDGLITQAKSQLWRIVNELALAKKEGVSPRLEVAIFEYGNSGLPEGEGYMRMVTSFTGDLDKVSARLFELTTNGGDEYCGMVIDSALKNLAWDKSGGSLKLIFIAGNEPFDQGNTRYSESVKRAKERGVVVNTIYCGDIESGIASYWKNGADLGGGRYFSIDQNAAVMVIQAPQDAELAQLNDDLNATYMAYGPAGHEKKKEQEKQDSNAEELSYSSKVERTISKASDKYNSSGWDIVDGVKGGSVNLPSMKDDDLPAEMKGMNDSQRKEYVEKMSRKRAKIQERILKLSEERRVYIDRKQKEMSNDETLDSAVIKTIREQGREKKFNFK